jgi:hypothetical protein
MWCLFTMCAVSFPICNTVVLMVEGSLPLQTHDS